MVNRKNSPASHGVLAALERNLTHRTPRPAIGIGVVPLLDPIGTLAIFFQSEPKVSAAIIKKMLIFRLLRWMLLSIRSIWKNCGDTTIAANASRPKTEITRPNIRTLSSRARVNPPTQENARVATMAAIAPV